MGLFTVKVDALVVLLKLLRLNRTSIFLTDSYFSLNGVFHISPIHHFLPANRTNLTYDDVKHLLVAIVYSLVKLEI